MTLVSQIITDAFRISNLIAIGTTPTTNEQAEALRYLNRLVKSVFGKEAGEDLKSFPIGNSNIVRPSGYPGWDEEVDGDWFVPENTRVVFNLSVSTNLYLHPEPNDGARFAVTDVSGNLATYPVVVYGNGRLIENASSVTLNTDSLSSAWFYRADTSNWVKYAELLTSDTFPFPEEFDDFFIIMLAMRLNPSYGTTIDEQASMLLSRSRSQLKARYSQAKQMNSELGLVRLSRMATDRDSFEHVPEVWYDSTSLFNRGIPS